MKNILHKRLFILQLLCTMATLMFIVGCEDNGADIRQPVITEIRNYAASPDDSVLQSLLPGQWIVLTGKHLDDAVQILFNGVPASVNRGILSANHAVVQVPSVIPFPDVPADKLNTIQYITERGSITLTFNIVAPAPSITAISNENANVGDMVYLYGTNLFLLTKLSFAGTEITEYSSSPDGTYVNFILTELNGSGPVVAENESGSYSTLFNVNDNTGMLCDFDDVNTLSWGPSVDNSSTTFPGNRGNYAILRNNGLSAGNFSWWEGDRGINTNAVQWIPEESLSAPMDEYVVKFEMNVPEKWNGTSLFILKDYNWDYIARFEPWDLGNGKTMDVSTNGNWVTVTVPFSQFRTKANGKDGTGIPASNLKALLGDAGNGSFHIYTINDSSAPAATSLTIAIDNIRVVKIK